MRSFIPLQIYTTLKQCSYETSILAVSFPYKFTLLSNLYICFPSVFLVSFPYKFTLLSNRAKMNRISSVFHSPINLHYSQTVLSCFPPKSLFHSPINLHYSQTLRRFVIQVIPFHSPINLHYSQTSRNPKSSPERFHSPINLHYSQTVRKFRLHVSGFIPL